MTPFRLRALSLLVTLGALAQPAQAVPIDVNQIDDFQDGTTQGWGSGPTNPNPPVNVTDVGPAGIGDDSLQITSTGGVGPGSRLTAFNTTQWAGDYLTPGVLTIIADVNNVGATNLDLRLGLVGPGGAFASATPVVLPALSGWQIVEFSLDAADLVAVSAGATLDLTLSNVAELRVFHSAGPPTLGLGGSPNGEPIVAQLLVDNIMVPEPSKPLLLATGLAALLGLARWRAHANPICRRTGSAD